MMKNLVALINYLFLFLSINYKIISHGIMHTDNSGYLLMLMSVLVLIANIQKIVNLISKRPFVFAFTWCIYVVINYYLTFNKCDDISFVRLYNIVLIPFFSLCIAYLEYLRNPIPFLKKILAFFVILITLAIQFDPALFTEGTDLNMREGDTILGNSFANTVCLLFIPLIILRKQKKINVVLFYVIAILTLLALAYTGTRKGFFVSFLILGFDTLGILNWKSIKSYLFVSVLIFCLWFGYNWISENTIMGQRMEFLEEQQNLYTSTQIPAFLHIFGDRAPHYYYGFLEFTEHPIFGVGLLQTRILQPGFGMAYVHPEYIAQLTDNGLIGFMLFMGLYLWIGINLIIKLKRGNNLASCFLLGFLAICFIDLFAWTYDSAAVFIILGITIGFLKEA